MKFYTVSKMNIKTGEEIKYGIQNEEDMKAITKGYHFNGLFYERKNSNTIYVVDEYFEN